MKKEIHPKYYKEAEVTCACGNKFKVGSTQEKIVDTMGRVEKFKQRMAAKQTKK